MFAVSVRVLRGALRREARGGPVYGRSLLRMTGGPTQPASSPSRHPTGAGRRASRDGPGCSGRVGAGWGSGRRPQGFCPSGPRGARSGGRGCEVPLPAKHRACRWAASSTRRLAAAWASLDQQLGQGSVPALGSDLRQAGQVGQGGCPSSRRTSRSPASSREATSSFRDRSSRWPGGGATGAPSHARTSTLPLAPVPRWSTRSGPRAWGQGPPPGQPDAGQPVHDLVHVSPEGPRTPAISGHSS